MSDQSEELRPSAVERWAHRGQVMILFAIFLVALMGALGLSIDLGLAFSQRRALQNAADASALAGARLVVKSTPSAPISVLPEVEEVALANIMRFGRIDSIDCSYIIDSGYSNGSCARYVTTGTTGVKVIVTETHQTFFMRVVPGAPAYVTVSAEAKAHVMRVAAPRDGPFLPCARNTQLAEGGAMDILVKSTDNEWVMNPDAIGRTFKIHGPQIEKCQAKASRYKGLADVEANRYKDTPDWFNYKEGDTAGVISIDVEGPDGCKAGQEAVNCVAFLPIVVEDPPEAGNNRELWAITFAPFYITAPKSNEHYGRLISNYVVYGRNQIAQWGWHQGYVGPIVIRLTG
jgi:Flp pilus assembly protein TadG